MRCLLNIYEKQRGVSRELAKSDATNLLFYKDKLYSV